jgi:hypothetical protein
MKLPRVRFTVRWLMVVVAVVALVCSVDWSEFRDRTPRALLPGLTAIYLAWAAVDGWRLVRVSQPCVLRFALPLAAVALAGACVLSWRVESFRAMAGRHDWNAELCQRSSRGESGTIIACGPKGCSFFDIPKADTAAERAKMLRLAQYHLRMRSKYEHAASRPWLPIGSDPPLPD